MICAVLCAAVTALTLQTGVPPEATPAATPPASTDAETPAAAGTAEEMPVGTVPNSDAETDNAETDNTQTPEQPLIPSAAPHQLREETTRRMEEMFDQWEAEEESSEVYTAAYWFEAVPVWAGGGPAPPLRSLEWAACDGDDNEPPADGGPAGPRYRAAVYEDTVVVGWVGEGGYAGFSTSVQLQRNQLTPIEVPVYAGDTRVIQITDARNRRPLEGAYLTSVSIDSSGLSGRDDIVATVPIAFDKSVRSNADGLIFIPGIPAGIELNVRAEAEGYVGDFESTRRNELLIGLPPAKRSSVRVVDAEGRPVAGAAAWIPAYYYLSTDDRPSARSDADGVISLLFPKHDTTDEGPAVIIGEAGRRSRVAFDPKPDDPPIRLDQPPLKVRIPAENVQELIAENPEMYTEPLTGRPLLETETDFFNATNLLEIISISDGERMGRGQKGSVRSTVPLEREGDDFVGSIAAAPAGVLTVTLNDKSAAALIRDDTQEVRLTLSGEYRNTTISNVPMRPDGREVIVRFVDESDPPRPVLPHLGGQLRVRTRLDGRNLYPTMTASETMLTRDDAAGVYRGIVPWPETPELDIDWPDEMPGWKVSESYQTFPYPQETPDEDDESEKDALEKNETPPEPPPLPDAHRADGAGPAEVTVVVSPASFLAGSVANWVPFVQDETGYVRILGQSKSEESRPRYRWGNVLSDGRFGGAGFDGENVVVLMSDDRRLVARPPASYFSQLGDGEIPAWVVEWQSPAPTVLRAVDAKGKPAALSEAEVQLTLGGVPRTIVSLDDLESGVAEFDLQSDVPLTVLLTPEDESLEPQSVPLKVGEETQVTLPPKPPKPPKEESPDNPG